MRLYVQGRKFDPAAEKPAENPAVGTPPFTATIAAGLGDAGFHTVSQSNPRPEPPAQAPPAGTITDEQLLSAYRAGDRASFDALVKRYERELYHFLIRFMGNRAAADDAFQETFLQVHQSADTFDAARHFRPWLFTIAANKARDLLRSQNRRNTTPLEASMNPNDDDGGRFVDMLKSPAALPSQPMEESEMRDLVHQTIAGMPQHLREIVLLSYFHQFPYKTIGDILGIPLGTVKSRLHAAVAFFAHRWNALHLPPPTL
jgi:RNA polymerase sigma-70 factor (ECF subfamily)